MGTWQEPDDDRYGVKALDALLAYDWPGNVCELQNELARAVAR